MANLFDKFFIHVSQKINDEIPRTPKTPLDYLRHYNEKSFCISPSSATEIEILISSFIKGGQIGRPIQHSNQVMKDSLFLYFTSFF